MCNCSGTHGPWPSLRNVFARTLHGEIRPASPNHSIPPSLGSLQLVVGAKLHPFHTEVDWIIPFPFWGRTLWSKEQLTGWLSAPSLPTPTTQTTSHHPQKSRDKRHVVQLGKSRLLCASRDSDGQTPQMCYTAEIGCEPPASWSLELLSQNACSWNMWLTEPELWEAGTKSSWSACSPGNSYAHLPRTLPTLQCSFEWLGEFVRG